MMMTTGRARLGALALLLALSATGAARAEPDPCRRTEFEGVGYTLCDADAGDDLRLWLNDAEGQPLGTFERLRQSAEARGGRLVFAMNAGMYHPDRRPVGLYVENGRQVSALVRGGGGGNFGLKPNGVFCILPDRFAVIETGDFARTAPPCRFATQSGPMLVLAGALHPRFLAGSESLYIRNGVGVSRDGRQAVFVISDAAVNFHDFARFFRDGLGLDQALYLDGSISRLYAPGLGRNDIGLPMGPMVGLLARN